MCLILFGFRAHWQYPLVVAANRDEHHGRAAAPAAFWSDHTDVYGGRDLEKGGSWMGIPRRGRFAAITNFREGPPGPAAPRSRGALVSGFLTGNATTQDFVTAMVPTQSDYAGFGMIIGDLESLLYCTNRGPAATTITPGVHGLSNHLLDAPWPKIRRGTMALDAALAHPDESTIEALLFAALADRTPGNDADLPDTGIALQRERQLSPAFICGAEYGTRASTVLLAHASGTVLFHEKRYGPNGQALDEHAARFSLSTASARPADD